MVGSIIHHEMLLGSRRSRSYVLRWIYAGWLILQFLFLYAMYRFDYWSSTTAAFGTGMPDTNATGRFAGSYLSLFVKQQIILLLLAVPVFTAGAVTDEKTRGTLQYLMTTDLWSWHIVVGKLLGRVAQVGLLALSGLPVICFIGVYGGLEPLPLFALSVVTVLTVFALGSASMLASVWNRQTRDAVLSLYAVGGVLFVVAWWLAPGVLEVFNPLYVIEPSWGGAGRASINDFGQRLLLSTVVLGGVTLVCLSLAVWRLRPAYIRQLEQSGNRPRIFLGARRPAVPDDPLPWKERHVEGLAPLKAMRIIPTWLAMLVIFTVTTVISTVLVLPYLPSKLTLTQLWDMVSRGEFKQLGDMLTQGPGIGVPGQGPAEEFFIQSIVAMLLASLMVGIRCSGTVSGEREKQTWEALLLTPLTSKQIIGGKVWGIMGASYLYVLAYAVPALALSAVGSMSAAIPMPFLWTILWLGVTWLAMYFVGAAGVWCSVRSRTSWRSLLGTLGIGYVGGFIIYLLTTPILAVLALIVLLLLFVVDKWLNTSFGMTALQGIDLYWLGFKVTSCLGLAGIFFGLARFFLADAQKWVADRERTRHWKDEPTSRPSTRRRSVAKPRYYR